MMLSHEIFDPEFGKRVLIDQAFIVAGGEITKQALNWARQRTRRLAATVDQLHGPQRHPGLVRSEQPSLARVRALTANLARRPTLWPTLHACCQVSADLADSHVAKSVARSHESWPIRSSPWPPGRPACRDGARSTHNGTASGVKGLETGELPPLAVPMWVGSEIVDREIWEGHRMVVSQLTSLPCWVGRRVQGMLRATPAIRHRVRAARSVRPFRPLLLPRWRAAASRPAPAHPVGKQVGADSEHRGDGSGIGGSTGVLGRRRPELLQVLRLGLGCRPTGLPSVRRRARPPVSAPRCWTSSGNSGTGCPWPP